MYTRSQVQPLLALVAEIASMSAADGCADGYTVTSGDAVDAAAAVAKKLEGASFGLVIGQHDHRHGSSHYAFGVPAGAQFGEAEFQAFLGDQFEPDREEFANVIAFPEKEIQVLAAPEAQPEPVDFEPLEVLIEAAKQHGEDSEPDHEVGDLQDFLRAMWELLTPEQRLAYAGLPAVRDTYRNATGDIDQPFHPTETPP